MQTRTQAVPDDLLPIDLVAQMLGVTKRSVWRYAPSVGDTEAEGAVMVRYEGPMGPGGGSPITLISLTELRAFVDQLDERDRGQRRRKRTYTEDPLLAWLQAGNDFLTVGSRHPDGDIKWPRLEVVADLPPRQPVRMGNDGRVVIPWRATQAGDSAPAAPDSGTRPGDSTTGQRDTAPGQAPGVRDRAPGQHDTATPQGDRTPPAGDNASRVSDSVTPARDTTPGARDSTPGQAPGQATGQHDSATLQGDSATGQRDAATQASAIAAAVRDAETAAADRARLMEAAHQNAMVALRAELQGARRRGWWRTPARHEPSARAPAPRRGETAPARRPAPGGCPGG